MNWSSKWEIRRFDEVAEVVTGATPSTKHPEYYGGEIPFIAPADLDQAMPISSSKSTLTECGANQGRRLPAGAILVCCIGATIGKVGVTSCESTTNQQINALVPNSELLDSKFGYYFCRYISHRFRQLGTSTTLPILNKGRFSKIEIPLPPLPEQKRIAEILDRAEALRRSRRAALALLDELTQSIFLEMFGDPRERIAEEGVALETVTEEFRYGTSNKSSDDGYPTLRIPNVVGSRIDCSDMKNVAVTEADFDRLNLVEGDLLFVRTNGNPDYVGRCAVFEKETIEEARLDPSKFIYASYLIRARMKDDVHPAFIQALMTTREGRRQTRSKSKTSAGQYNINTKGLGAIPVFVPKMEHQLDFVDRLHAVREKHRILQQSADTLDSLFSSLQQRAFRGEL